MDKHTITTAFTINPVTHRLGRMFVLSAVICGYNSLCFGSAFSVSELGARAAGMGTAFVATADDSSALFYNPAGIAFQPGSHLQMDATVVVGLFRFTPSATPVGQVVPPNGFSQSIKPHFIPLASLYATAQLSKRWTIGFGSFTPFGLSANSTNFNDSDPNLTKFVGRFAGTRARLESFWFQPTVAYRFNDSFAIGIGPAIVHTHLFLEKSFLNPLDDALTFGKTAAPTVLPGVPVSQAGPVVARLLPEGRSRIAGSSTSPAIAGGLLWKLNRAKTNIGFSYRSSVTNHLDGKASFAFGTGYALEQYIGPSFLPKAFPTQSIKGSFTTPATYTAGVSTSKFFNTLLEVDVRMQDYKKFSSVPLNFSINETTPGYTNIGLPAEQRLVFDFRRSWDVGVGMERHLNKVTTLRLGYLYDRSPVVDKSVGPLFPDATRNSFTVGATRTIKNKEFTFFYEAMKFMDRQTNVAANNIQWTNGDYHNFAHVAGIGLRVDLENELFHKKH